MNFEEPEIVDITGDDEFDSIFHRDDDRQRILYKNTLYRLITNLDEQYREMNDMNLSAKQRAYRMKLKLKLKMLRKQMESFSDLTFE